MKLTRRVKKRYRIEGPEAPEGPEDRTEGGPEVQDGPIVDMEMRGGRFRKKRRWWQRLKRDTATLETLTWDGQRYILKTYEVTAEDLPDTAVHVTGKKGRWFVDAVDREGRDDLQVRYDPEYKVPDAVDIYLYAITNAFDEALMIRGQGAPKDVKKIVVWLMVIGVAACVAWVFIGPMLRRLPIENVGSFLVLCRQST